MKKLVEQTYPGVPHPVILPDSLRVGYKYLWEQSAATGREWIGATTFSGGEYGFITLGYQSPSYVTQPIVNLRLAAQLERRPLSFPSVHEYLVQHEYEIRKKPDPEGGYYQGKVLFLLPRQEMPAYADLMSKKLTEGDMILPEEEFLGVDHTHLSRHPLSHLPSLDDFRLSVFRSLSYFTLDAVISGDNISVLAKSKNTECYQHNPCVMEYQNQIEVADRLAAEGGNTMIEVLSANCQRYKVLLYSGQLSSGELYPFFQEVKK